MKIRNYFRGLVICFLICSMFTLTAYAEEFDWDKFPCVTPESMLLQPQKKKSLVRYQPFLKGDFITNATLSISNEENGTIGVYAQTLAYVKIDKCRMRIYLDRWIEEENRWAMVDNWDFTITEPEPPETELTMATLSFNVINQPAGNYYRLRGLHAVWLNGKTESFSTQTDGVYITK